MAFRWLANIIAPPICISCGWPGSWLCKSCHSHLTWIDSQIDWWNLINLDAGAAKIWSATEYVDLAKDIVVRVKYQRQFTLCRLQADIMNQAFGRNMSEIKVDWLVPIPITTARQRWRGFNQAALIAKHLSNYTNISYNLKALRRLDHGTAHAKKNRQQRQAELPMFEANPVVCQGKTICLIDDVVTTGSTLKTAAGACRQAGASQIFAATFAVTIG